MCGAKTALDNAFATCKDARMLIKDFIARFGREELDAIAAKAGTTLGYLSEQVANGHRNPSPDLAKKLVAASGGRLTLAELRPDLWGRAA